MSRNLLFIAMTAAFALTACGSDGSESPTGQPDNNATTPDANNTSVTMTSANNNNNANNTSKTTPKPGTTTGGNNAVNNGANNTAGTTTQSTTTPPPEPGVVMASARARVKFKGGKRWGAQLARALGGTTDQLCKEFGKYDCINQVHNISLGGVEPYKLGVDKPIEPAPITAPIAVERVALSACEARAKADLADIGAAVIFKEMPSSGAPDDEQVRQMSTRLVQRIFSRDITPEEVAQFVAFRDELAADLSAGDDPRLAWGTLSCFVMATSVEALFY